jgi:hypothetical protein
LQIDDRFGWQIRYRCGADVLDAGDELWLKQGFEAIAFLLAPPCPGGVGLDKIHGFVRPRRQALLGTHTATPPGRSTGAALFRMVVNPSACR